jgi:hypothetical protein
MQIFAKILGVFALTAFLVLLGAVLGTLTGALSGWLVGIWFSDWLLPVFARVGLGGFPLWQLGAFFGFIGGFIRSHLQQQKQ